LDSRSEVIAKLAIAEEQADESAYWVEPDMRIWILDFRFWILDYQSEATGMNEQQFKARTKQVALRIIRVVEALPMTRTADIIGRQLLRAGTSVGAGYRAACRGKSPADVIAKLAIVEEKADESAYWLELLVEAEIVRAKRLALLIAELNEIVAMVVASQKTLRRNHPKSKIRR
jgi:four helix bundle protein